MEPSPFRDESDDTLQAQAAGFSSPNPLDSSTVDHDGSPQRGAPPPPLLSQHYTLPHSPSSPDILHLIKYLEQSRLYEDARRQREEICRRQEEDRRRQEEDLRRQEESARFTALLEMLAPITHQSVTAASSATSLPVTTDPTTPLGPSSSTSIPPPQKAIAQNPPPLRADATFQVFREWRRRWDDYAIMVDLSKLPREKELIQLRMCLILETQRILEHTLEIPPSTGRSVNEVLDALQTHIKSMRNKVLRRRELLSCKH